MNSTQPHIKNVVRCRPSALTAESTFTNDSPSTMIVSRP